MIQFVLVTPLSLLLCSQDLLQQLLAGADTTGSNTVSASTGDTVSVFPMVTTHYRVIGDTNGVMDTTYFTVTIVTPPSVKLSADSTGCFGDSLMFVGKGASTYEWFSTLSFPNFFCYR